MANYGFKISKKGFNAETKVKDEQAYNSSNNYVYILQQGRQAPANDIAHPFGIFPMVELFAKDTSNSWWKAQVGGPGANLVVAFDLTKNEIQTIIAGGDSADEVYHTILNTSLSYV